MSFMRPHLSWSGLFYISIIDDIKTIRRWQVSKKTAYTALFCNEQDFIPIWSAVREKGENARLAAHSIQAVFHTGHLGSPLPITKLFRFNEYIRLPENRMKKQKK